MDIVCCDVVRCRLFGRRRMANDNDSVDSFTRTIGRKAHQQQHSASFVQIWTNDTCNFLGFRCVYITRHVNQLVHVCKRNKPTDFGWLSSGWWWRFVYIFCHILHRFGRFIRIPLRTHCCCSSSSCRAPLFVCGYYAKQRFIHDSKETPDMQLIAKVIRAIIYYRIEKCLCMKTWLYVFDERFGEKGWKHNRYIEIMRIIGPCKWPI